MVLERNSAGYMVVDFVKRMEMLVVNTYFRKREEHRVRRVYTGGLHLLQKVQSERNRRLQVGVRGECS